MAVNWSSIERRLGEEVNGEEQKDIICKQAEFMVMTTYLKAFDVEIRVNLLSERFNR